MPKENPYEGAILLTPEQLGMAKEGFVVVSDGKGNLVLVDPSYISEKAEKKAREALDAVSRFDAFTRHVKHFKKLCRSHFINAFTLWKTKVMEGDVPLSDQSLLNADEDVLFGKKTVADALAENGVLRDIFVRIYGEYDENEDDGDDVAFPEV